MIQKDYDRKSSVVKEEKKNNLVVVSRGLAPRGANWQ
jgi:hypothetical protein